MFVVFSLSLSLLCVIDLDDISLVSLTRVNKENVNVELLLATMA